MSHSEEQLMQHEHMALMLSRWLEQFTGIDNNVWLQVAATHFCKQESADVVSINKIRELDAANMTQREIAEELGASRSVVNRLCRAHGIVTKGGSRG